MAPGWERSGPRRPTADGRVRRVATAALALTVAVLTAALALTAPASGRDRFTIVSIGDSFASGEGNPIEPGEHNETGELIGRHERWGPPEDADARRCHRSPLAHGAQAVELLRRRFPDLAIEFVHVACSGATITKGLLGAYEGVEPRSGAAPMAPQLRQVNAALRRAGIGRADALVVNIGVNDIGFADLLRACLVFYLGDCDKQQGTVDTTMSRLATLSSRFDRLQRAISGRSGATAPLDAVPGRTYLVEYPDPTKDENGNYCHGKPQGDLLDQVTGSESRWVSEEVVPVLNQHVREAVDSARAVGLDWQYVSRTVEDFENRGFCAGRARFLNTTRDALLAQGADALALGPFSASNGMVHPNLPGHAAVAVRVAAAIERQIAAEYALGTPVLAVAGARARRPGVGPRIDVVWSTPSNRALARFELEIFRASRPGRRLRLVRLAANRNRYSHGQDGTGAFLYRVRACAPTGQCSPFSRAVRGSNVAPSAIGRPTNLRRVRAAGVVAVERQIAMRWDRVDDNWSWYELQYRRVKGPDTLPARPLTLEDERTIVRMRRENPGLVRGLPDPLVPLLRLDAYSLIRATTETATIGSPLHPLSPSASFEVRVRACSDVGCAAPTAATIEPVTRPTAGRIGEFELDRIQQPAPAPGTFGLVLGGTLRQPHGRLGSIVVRLRDAEGELTRITYDHGRDRLTLVTPRPGDERGDGRDRTPQRRTATLARVQRAAGPVGARRALRAGPFRLDLTRSRVTARGRQIRLRLAIALPRAVRGQRIAVEVAATDRRGRRQPFAPAGALLVRG